MRSLILDRAARGLLPVTTLFALYLLLRGHDHPGGGFIAGLVTSVAIVIEALAFGAMRTEAGLARALRPAAWVGLALAAGTGLISTAAGDGFFVHYRAAVRVGAGGGLHLTTTLLFDAGVYLVVVGMTATVLSLFARGVAS
ncbi:MnhB domain-containing protein [Sorangium sp. So ce1097]|uniref:MnhB domain-containing protein n=1 Tax=Sorangium sp. So ce1097 TaxID=3133330 RepID=UPI003F641DA1